MIALSLCNFPLQNGMLVGEYLDREASSHFDMIIPTPSARATLRVLATLVLLAFLCVPRSRAQAGNGAPSPSSAGSDPKSDTIPHVDGPEKGSNEWQVSAGGAYPIKVFDTQPLARMWTAGVTYGRVLTEAHGPGPLRGRFEWAFEFDPVVEVLLPKRAVYGVGLTPVVWKWDFVTRRRVSPYWELTGGVLFSNHQVIPGTTPFNFTANTAAGVSFPCGGSGKYSLSADVSHRK
jgi:hypothetical protein